MPQSLYEGRKNCIERAERLAVVELIVNRSFHLTGVEILKAFNRSKVSAILRTKILC